MKKYVDGVYIEMTQDEITEMQAAHEASEHEHRQSLSYAEAVNAKIRELYTASQEFAILRQRDEKPEEYAAYYAYCEECKEFVRSNTID